MNDDLLELLKNLPAAFGRPEVRKLLPGVIAPGTLANLDSKGEGPPRINLSANRVVYERASFVKWLIERAQKARANAPKFDRASKSRVRKGNSERGGTWTSGSKV
jgi:flavin-dependent dehydrogenase